MFIIIQRKKVKELVSMNHIEEITWMESMTEVLKDVHDIHAIESQ